MNRQEEIELMKMIDAELMRDARQANNDLQAVECLIWMLVNGVEI